MGSRLPTGAHRTDTIACSRAPPPANVRAPGVLNGRGGAPDGGQAVVGTPVP